METIVKAESNGGAPCGALTETVVDEIPCPEPPTTNPVDDNNNNNNEITCKTAVQGDACSNKIEWVRDVGLKDFPDAYPTSLTQNSTDEEIQDYLHTNGEQAFCPYPACILDENIKTNFGYFDAKIMFESTQGFMNDHGIVGKIVVNGDEAQIQGLSVTEDGGSESGVTTLSFDSFFTKSSFEDPWYYTWAHLILTIVACIVIVIGVVRSKAFGKKCENCSFRPYIYTFGLTKCGKCGGNASYKRDSASLKGFQEVKADDDT
eukprot:Pgem_evm1s519